MSNSKRQVYMTEKDTAWYFLDGFGEFGVLPAEIGSMSLEELITFRDGIFQELGVGADGHGSEKLTYFGQSWFNELKKLNILISEKTRNPSSENL